MLDRAVDCVTHIAGHATCTYAYFFIILMELQCVGFTVVVGRGLICRVERPEMNVGWSFAARGSSEGIGSYSCQSNQPLLKASTLLLMQLRTHE